MVCILWEKLCNCVFELQIITLYYDNSFCIFDRKMISLMLLSEYSDMLFTWGMDIFLLLFVLEDH